mmetsp:Transcript_26015/g.42675  ORF Transcript_26015/g.42675 Transcript_26015/m.42675 type:complete len:220 (-) Transcript_26015:2234-2893(-)
MLHVTSDLIFLDILIFNLFCGQPFFRIDETKELYRSIVLPYITRIPQSRIQWVYNILSKDKEAERILFEDPDPETGFIVLPDFKWDGKTLGALYVVAIVHGRGIASIRDLTSKHLPLLNNIRSKVYKTLSDKFGLESTKIRAFFHYHPSYYHLHVHFVHSSMNTLNCSAGKAHLLEDVIENIEMKSDYYQEKTLVHFIPQSHDLYPLLTASRPGTTTGQ